MPGSPVAGKGLPSPRSPAAPSMPSDISSAAGSGSPSIGNGFSSGSSPFPAGLSGLSSASSLASSSSGEGFSPAGSSSASPLSGDFSGRVVLSGTAGCVWTGTGCAPVGSSRGGSSTSCGSAPSPPSPKSAQQRTPSVREVYEALEHPICLRASENSWSPVPSPPQGVCVHTSSKPQGDSVSRLLWKRSRRVDTSSTVHNREPAAAQGVVPSSTALRDTRAKLPASPDAGSPAPWHFPS